MRNKSEKLAPLQTPTRQVPAVQTEAEKWRHALIVRRDHLRALAEASENFFASIRPCFSGLKRVWDCSGDQHPRFFCKLDLTPESVKP